MNEKEINDGDGMRYTRHRRIWTSSSILRYVDRDDDGTIECLNV